MWRVVSCLTQQHDLRLVAAAGLLCVIGTLFTFKLLERAQTSAADARWQWLLAAGVGGGSTIWATHFIAMLAYRGAMPILFGAPLTIASAGLGILFAYAGFSRVLRDGRSSIIQGTLLLVVGIAVMHFVGMMALQAPGRVVYDYVLVGCGVVVAVALGGGAVLAFRNLLGKARIGVPTLLFTLAICAAHFVSMSAMTLVPDPTVVFDSEAQSIFTVASEVAIVIAVLTAVLAMLIGRDAHRLTSFVNATLEGIVIVRGNRIVDVNAQLLELVGRTRASVGQLVADLLPGLGEEERVALRANPSIEIDIPGPDGAIPVEIVRREVTLSNQPAEVLIVRDLTERRAAQAQIAFLAHHDVLTGLPNRALFHDRLVQALATADRSGSKVALMALDLDGFKGVNDFHGHAAGDEVLCRVARLLGTVVRASDTVARLGGDEFAIIQSSVGQPEDAQALAARLLASFEEEFGSDDGRSDSLSVSIGIALYPGDAAEPEVLQRKSDVALGRAKAAGKAGWHFFRHDMDAEVNARVLLERELKASITEQQLFLVYQPQADAATGKINGFEALVRWRHPERGIVPPLDFIPLAEECGFIVQLGRWVLREACTAAAGWAVPLQIAVNVSPLEFGRGKIAAQIEAVLTETGLDPRRLEIEITESALVKDREATLTALHRLRAIGVRIAMDDFGTGYSSLSNLHAFPFDKIKIDRSFVSNLENDTAAGTIVRAIIGLGSGLRLPITAEGVETVGQLAMLRRESCSEVQGYFIGKPLDIGQYSDVTSGVAGSDDIDRVVVDFRRSERPDPIQIASVG